MKVKCPNVRNLSNETNTTGFAFCSLLCLLKPMFSDGLFTPLKLFNIYVLFLTLVGEIVLALGNNETYNIDIKIFDLFTLCSSTKVNV